MHNRVIKIMFTAYMVLLCTSYTGYAANDTTHIYFRLDKPDMDRQTTQQIDSLLYNDVINSSHSILVIGYADHLGSNEYNDVLSEHRAKNVKDYLQQMGIPGKQITLCVGRGEVPRDMELPDGYAADRRVDIVNITGKAKVTAPQKTKQPGKQKKPTVELMESKDAVVFNSTVIFKPEAITAGQLFVLDRIFFHTGQHIIIEESLKELEALYKLLEENDNLVVRIEGHVCCVPPTTDALDIDTGEIALSLNRSRYIYQYLVKKGIAKERLSFVGFGKSRPLSRNEYTMEQQDLNKRVEMRIISK